MEAITNLDALTPSSESTIDIHHWLQTCYDAMNDDFNSPILIAQLFEGVRFVNLLKEGRETLANADLLLLTTKMKAFVFDVLGLNEEKIASEDNKIDDLVNILIDMRMQARANKDFALSDQIRDQLLAIGIQLKDGKEQTTFSIN